MMQTYTAIPLLIAALYCISLNEAYQVPTSLDRRNAIVSHQLQLPVRYKIESSPSNTTPTTETTTETTETTTSTSSKTNTLPPVLQHIVNERAEYQMNVGKAMDTLRNDMPYILSRTPDFSIYHTDISVIDPSGVQLHGIDKYKSSILFLQTFTKFWFRNDDIISPQIQFRMIYDVCRNSIRISWHCTLISKFVPSTLQRPLHIDGISYYQLDIDSGKIIEHKIETLIVNNTPITPPYGILSILQHDTLLRPIPQGIPTYIRMMNTMFGTTKASSSISSSNTDTCANNNNIQQQQHLPLLDCYNR